MQDTRGDAILQLTNLLEKSIAALLDQMISADNVGPAQRAFVEANGIALILYFVAGEEPSLQSAACGLLRKLGEGNVLLLSIALIILRQASRDSPNRGSALVLPDQAASKGAAGCGSTRAEKPR